MILEGIKDILHWAQQFSPTTKVVILTTTAVVIVRWATKRRYKLPPGPRPLPLLGNILEFRKESILDKWTEWKEKYGPVVTCYVGPKMTIILNDFEAMNEAYLKRGPDFSSRPYLYSMDIMTEGLKDIALAPYGEVWKYQRKVASQAMRQYLTGTQLEKRVHETLLPIIESLKGEKKAFNPHRYLSLSVCNVLHGLCFGSTLHVDDPTFIRILDIFDKASENIGNGFLEDFFPPLRWWPTKKFKHFVDDVVELNEYMDKQLQKRKACFNPDRIESLVDNIILAQQQALQDDPNMATMFTETHARQIVNDVFSAGLDTSRQTLDWLFLVLVAHPDVQTKMQQEIDRVVGDGIPGREHRQHLVYTEAVLLETMRLYYVAPTSVPHETTQDTTVGGYEIPAGVTVVTNNYAMMRDPKDWPNPLEFKPERFIASSNVAGAESKLVSRHDGYAPFSLGHRSCIGESLAKLELVYVIAGLLQKLTFSFGGGEAGQKPDMEPGIKGFAYMSKPYLVKVTSRK